jgi:hypothetical protein
MMNGRVMMSKGKVSNSKPMYEITEEMVGKGKKEVTLWACTVLFYFSF